MSGIAALIVGIFLACIACLGVAVWRTTSPLDHEGLEFDQQAINDILDDQRETHGQ